jgi:hypothetical protein
MVLNGSVSVHIVSVSADIVRRAVPDSDRLGSAGTEQLRASNIAANTIQSATKWERHVFRESVSNTSSTQQNITL